MPEFLHHPDHHLHSLDFHVVYELRTFAHAELYALGLRARIQRLVPHVHVDVPSPGVLTLSEAHHHAYLMALTELRNPPPALAQRWVRDMRVSVWDTARANLQYERRPHRPGNLVQAAVHMMSYANLNDDLAAADALQARLAKDAMPTLQAALTPVVTPYLALLAQRTQKLADAPTPAEAARFQRDAAFLRQFDAPDDDLALPLPPAAMAVSQVTPAQRVYRRAVATRAVLSACPDLTALLTLAQVAADHEEARHYWQGRTLRNLRDWMRRSGLNPRTATLEDALSHAQVAA